MVLVRVRVRVRVMARVMVRVMVRVRVRGILPSRVVKRQRRQGSEC